MGISAAEAKRIHQLAQNAGIDDETIEAWCDGDTTITGERASGFKASAARDIERRIKEYNDPIAAVITTNPDAATDRQADYIASLLRSAIRQGSGPVESHALVRRLGPGEYEPNMDAIRALSKREATTTINILKESYL